MKLTFNKETGGDWYVDLPEYPGPKGDLQMVYGADTMLDILSKGEDTVSIVAAIDYAPTYTRILNKLIIPSIFDIGGQWYTMEHEHKTYAIWLCDVTKHVFGYFPDLISFKVV